MLHRRSTVLRAALGGMAVALAVTGGMVGSGSGRVPPSLPVPPVELPGTLDFDVRYTGLGAQGVDLTWRGLAGAPVPAQVTIRVEYAGPAGDRAAPVWPVNAWLFFSAEDLRSSFVAELSGNLDWRTGEMRVTGLASDGARLGLPVELRMPVAGPEWTGRVSVRFLTGATRAR